MLGRNVVTRLLELFRRERVQPGQRWKPGFEMRWFTHAVMFILRLVSSPHAEYYTGNEIDREGSESSSHDAGA